MPGTSLASAVAVSGAALPDEPVYGPGGERLTGDDDMQRVVNDQAGYPPAHSASLMH